MGYQLKPCFFEDDPEWKEVLASPITFEPLRERRFGLDKVSRKDLFASKVGFFAGIFSCCAKEAQNCHIGTDS